MIFISIFYPKTTTSIPQSIFHVTSQSLLHHIIENWKSSIHSIQNCKRFLDEATLTHFNAC